MAGASGNPLTVSKAAGRTYCPGFDNADSRHRCTTGTRWDGVAATHKSEDIHRYASDYLWRDVLAPANLLDSIGRFIHLELEEQEDWDGRKYQIQSFMHHWGRGSEGPDRLDRPKFDAMYVERKLGGSPKARAKRPRH